MTEYERELWLRELEVERYGTTAEGYAGLVRRLRDEGIAVRLAAREAREKQWR